MLVAWRMHAFDSIFEGNTEPLGLVIAAVLILAVGVIDDLREVSAPAKVVGHRAVGQRAGALRHQHPVAAHPVRRHVHPRPELVLPAERAVGAGHDQRHQPHRRARRAGRAASWPSPPATFFLYAQQLSHEGVLADGNIGPLIAVIVLGMCLGFLPWNIHPARIFMGDGGALLLGLLMAASTMVVGGRTDQPFSGQTFFFFAPVFIPLVILGVPIVDTAWAIVRRARTRIGPRPPPTRTTCTTGSCASATATGAACSSCGPGPRCSRASCSTRPTPTRATPSCRSASPRSASRSTRCCTPACARRAEPTPRRPPDDGEVRGGHGDRRGPGALAAAPDRPSRRTRRLGSGDRRADVLNLRPPGLPEFEIQFTSAAAPGGAFASPVGASIGSGLHRQSVTVRMSRVSASQRRELTQQMHKSTGSYELVLSPLILALIGYGLDRWLGTIPLLTIALRRAWASSAPASRSTTRYSAEMDEHEKDAPWAKHS